MFVVILTTWIVNHNHRKELETKAEVAMRALYKDVCSEETLLAWMGSRPLSEKALLLRRLRWSITWGLAGAVYIALQILLQNDVIPHSEPLEYLVFKYFAGGALVAAGIAGVITFLIGRKMLNDENDAKK